MRDLTPGDRDVPPFSLGGPDDYDVSPDGKEVCFSRKDDALQAASTNADLFVVPVSGGEPRKIAANPGYDGACRYSPDGSAIAFRAQMRGGYESDRWRLLVYDRKSGAVRTLTEAFDRQVGEPSWSLDSKTLYFAAEDDGRSPVFSVPAAGGAVKTVVAGGSFGDPKVAGRTLVFTKVALTHPPEIYRANLDGTGLLAVTKVNDAFLAGFKLRPGESVRYPGAAGKTVQAWIVRPADFDPAKKYPLLVLIHGGPQGAWEDGWTFRWNAQVFAGAGYVVFMPNPRGSTGFGQEFVDDINGDWGGRCYEDILRGTDYAEALPYVDPGRTVAAGASFGGYMINWIAGHTDRYKALVSHDGLFDLDVHVRLHRGALVCRMGVQGHALGQPRGLREVDAVPPREELQDAHPRRARRARLPRAPRARPPDVHGLAAPGRPQQARGVSRREPLGPEARELAPLVRGSARLARPVVGPVGGFRR